MTEKTSREDEIRARLKALSSGGFEGYAKAKIALSEHGPNDLRYLLEKVERLEKAIRDHHERLMACPLKGDETDRVLWEKVGIDTPGLELDDEEPADAP